MKPLNYDSWEKIIEDFSEFMQRCEKLFRAEKTHYAEVFFDYEYPGTIRLTQLEYSWGFTFAYDYFIPVKALDEEWTDEMICAYISSQNPQRRDG